MFNVVLRSIGKGLKATGILAGSAAVLAAGTALASPEAIGALFGPGGAIAVVVINLVGRTIQDAMKHRDAA